MKRYNPTEIEPKWQQIWADDGRYAAKDFDDKPKYYVTGMFPYPSGVGMHTGHFMEHSIVDAVARFRRALGYNVMYPMGWDSFGLPAENFAIKTGKKPQDTTAENIANFKNQLQRVGASIDWSREVNTADPEYYKWTQWIFTQLFERDLAYQKEANQWWCPKDKTVLANEQVVNGRCWRCETLVVKKPMKQWFFKITDYADALLDEIPALDWPEKIKTAQTNWIGRSEGAEVEFVIGDSVAAADSLKFTPQLSKLIIDGTKTSTIRLEPKKLSVGDIAELLTRHDESHVSHLGKATITQVRTMKLRDIPNDLAGHEPMVGDEQKLIAYRKYYDDGVTLETEFTIYDFEFIRDTITVFTTRPDTLFGATFLVLAPEHPLVGQLVNDDTRPAVEAYVAEAVKRSEIDRMAEGKEKTGVFTGSYATNPANGEKVPIWIADYVLWGYGTGAVMGVPAHDERDFAFAEKFELPIIQVLMPSAADPFNPPQPNLEEVVRDTVIVHLQDKSTGKFAVLDWHESLDGITTAIMGGIEDGQTVEDAARMEISEEAGLNVVTIVKSAPWVTAASYCASHKGQNRKAIARVVLAEVENLEDQTDVAAYEKTTHTLRWVNREDMLSALTPDHQKMVWMLLENDEIIRSEGELINSGQFDGMRSEEAREQIVAWLEQQGVGRAKVTYKMRDWLISRQRYWGAPIPIIHCQEHGAVAVPARDLPVILPDIDDFAPRGDGKTALGSVEAWVNTTCPTCGGPAKRETDTMDGYACSSWYLLRYTDAHNADQAWDPAKANYWAPLDMYVGGDHAVAHLLYVRFWTHVFHDMKLLDVKEPVKQLVYHGLIQAEDGRKMSKSLGNVVDPLDVIDQGYGADALRTYELFLGPINENSNWSSRGITGSYRFLNRVWTLVQEYEESEKASADDARQLTSLTHALIKKVTDDYHRLSFNTAIAAMMEYVNELYKLKMDGFSEQWQFAIESLIKLLQPLAPHMTAELWQQLGHDGALDVADWPIWDDGQIVSDTMTIIVQVNGKLRAKLDVSTGTTGDDIKALALADEHVKRFVTAEPKKVIYIPGKLVSIVV
ncbi:MAG TPA: class I tRNA ligase family protein [Candidatus Saccharimonas sp.]|nr:class I tRNA ligase family protein [Candidatus Saccharimonas sp.]